MVAQAGLLGAPIVTPNTRLETQLAWGSPAGRLRREGLGEPMIVTPATSLSCAAAIYEHCSITSAGRYLPPRTISDLADPTHHSNTLASLTSLSANRAAARLLSSNRHAFFGGAASTVTGALTSMPRDWDWRDDEGEWHDNWWGSLGR